MLQIIGKDSPVIAGFGVADSLEDEPDRTELQVEALDISTTISLSEDARTITEKLDYNVATAPPVKQKKKIVVNNDNSHKSEIDLLKKQKLELQILNLRMMNYNLQIDLYGKEKNHGIPPSEFTREIAGTSSNQKLSSEEVYIDPMPMVYTEEGQMIVYNVVDENNTSSPNEN